MASQSRLDVALGSNSLIFERARSIIFRRRGNLCLSRRICPPMGSTVGSLGLETAWMTSDPKDTKIDSMAVSGPHPRVAHIQTWQIKDRVDKPFFESYPPPESNIEVLVRILVHEKIGSKSGGLVGGDGSRAGVAQRPESEPKPSPKPQPIDPGYGSKSFFQSDVIYIGTNFSSSRAFPALTMLLLLETRSKL